MPLESDVIYPAAKFDPANILQHTLTLNKKLTELGKLGPAWYDVGAPTFRQMRLEGKTVFPRPVMREEGRNINIPSREATRSIPCRLFYPQKGAPIVKGLIMHIHGGGWVLSSHLSSDTHLADYANTSGCAVISAGYRLAPEYPFPSGPEDCFDVGEYLFKTAENEYGGPLRFIGGESAGAHLAVLTTFHLLRTHNDFSLPGGGLLLQFGCYDLSLLPSAHNLPQAPVLPLETMKRFIAAFAPTHSSQDLKSPGISPLYEDLEQFRGRLPAALFTCGTMDPLLDDTVLMSARWAIAGGTVVTKFYRGGVHGFIAQQSEEAELCRGDVREWIQGTPSKVEKVEVA